MNNQLSGLIAQGYTLITPTRRLCRHLQHQFAALQIKAGRTSWETPDLLPWEDWLRRTWEFMALDQGLDSLLLSSQQQQLVWQDIIGRSAHANQILQKTTTARQATRAWGLCQQWQIEIFPDDLYLNNDAFAFQHWARAFQQRCEKNGWIDEHRLAGVLARSAALLECRKIALVGFDEFTPQQRALFEKLEAAGCEVLQLPLQKRQKKSSAYGYTDAHAEIRAAACWARTLLESVPQASIGIVVPDLHARHQQVENIMEDVFHPGVILVHAEPQPRPYSISLGRPLLEYPLIDAAIMILGFGRQPVTLEELSTLLCSPFIKGHPQESQQRARFDAYLRKHGEYRATFATLRRLTGQKHLKPEILPAGFMQLCDEYQSAVQSMNKKQTASVWARSFTAVLKLCGWPGARILNSAEYQTVAEWQKLMDQFAGLEMVSSMLTYAEALNHLRQIVINSSFQPETEETPIQILGMTGAAGMQFDHLRIMGLHAGQWPPKAEPDPFIPIKLQRELGIPQATPALKLQQSEHLTQHLIDSSPEVALSYPQNDRDRPLRPSPLIKSFLQVPAQRPALVATDYASIQYHAGVQETIEDSQAPVIASGQTVSGGTSLYKDQAACPFKAFARHRLATEGLESKDIGLNAMDRGSLMHEVMEKFWKQVRGHQALLEKSADEINAIIHEVIQITLHDYQKRFPLTFSGRFPRLESDRIKAVLLQELDLERKRQPFIVKACEHWHTFTLNEITVRTRIDRIDQLMDGRIVIIDYKTGDAKVSAWLSERPDDPQLPLYAITSEGDIAAIIFARLKRGEVSFIGLAETDELLPGVTTVSNTRGLKDNIPDWQSLINEWHKTLSALATRFREGHAVVDPKNTSTCNQCDLHTLCRIYERDARYEIRDTDDE